MKKISLFVLLMLFFLKINATEYEWQDSFSNNNQKYLIENEVRYKWYKNIFIETIYELYNKEHASSYNLNDYIYNDYIKSDIYPEENDFREIVSYEEEKLLDKTIFNTIILNNFQINGTFTFDGFLIYDNNKNKLAFDITIIYENGEIVSNTKLNQSLNYYSLNIYNTEIKEIIIFFKEEFDINNINLNIFYRSYNSETKKMNLYFKYNEKYYTTSKEYDMNKHSSTCLNGYCLVDININDYLTSNYISNMYKYRDKLFKYDVYEKIYADEYYSYYEGYEKDIETAKIFYKYKNQEVCVTNKPDIDNKIIGSINDVKDNKLALNTLNKKSKITYNYILIFVTIFTTLSIILYLLLILLKKLINKCRTK